MHGNLASWCIYYLLCKHFPWLVGIDGRPRVLDIKPRLWLKCIDSSPVNCFLPEGFNLIYVDGLWMDSMRSTVCLFVWLKACYVFCLLKRYRCDRHVTGLRMIRSAWKLNFWKPQDNRPRKRLRCMWVILQCIFKNWGRSLRWGLVQKTSREQSVCGRIMSEWDLEELGVKLWRSWTASV